MQTKLPLGQVVARALVRTHQGFGCHPQSCGHHMMIMQPHTTQATLSAGLGPEGSNPLSFTSISILLCADTSLIAPQQLWTYLLSFPTWAWLYAPLFHVHVSIPSLPMW